MGPGKYLDKPAALDSTTEDAAEKLMKERAWACLGQKKDQQGSIRPAMLCIFICGFLTKGRFVGARSTRLGSYSQVGLKGTHRLLVWMHSGRTLRKLLV